MYQISKLSQRPHAKYSFIINIEAHQLFEVMKELEGRLGEQHPPPTSNDKDERPWYFVFVKDSIAERWRESDGTVALRLYINDEALAVQFLLMCDTTK